MDSHSSKVRKRAPKACRRCHRRKQRCVGAPRCTNCQTANVPCTRSDPRALPASERYHGMSKDALFSRIEALEAQLDAALNGSAGKIEDDHHHDDLDGYPSQVSLGVSYLSDVMDLLTSENVSRTRPAHLRCFPGSRLGRHMDHIFQGTTLLGSHSDTESEFGGHFQRDPLSVPSDADGLDFIWTYLETMHNQLPFLERAELFQLHRERDMLNALTPEAQWRSFKIFMVYAIGAATRRVSESYNATTPRTLFQTALRLKPPITELRSVQTIQALMLLIMYNLRSPSSANIWYMVGLAMRTAIDLGLHRESSYRNMKADESQKKRRLFWSVYLMDRSIARLLGRPFNIAEHDIDLALPPSYEEPVQNWVGRLGRGPPGTSIGVFIPSIKLVRLKSQIQDRVHRVDKGISLLLPEVGPLLSALEEYKVTLSSGMSPIDTDWLHMHWNNAIRILLQPFIGVLPPNHPLMHTCMEASGQMCQFFEGLYQKGYMGFGYILVSTLFKAGLTLCHCLLRSTRPCSTTVANDLRACSSVLFAVTGRNENLKKYRDAWDTMLTKAKQHFDQVSMQFNQTPDPTILLEDNPSLLGLGKSSTEDASASRHCSYFNHGSYTSDVNETWSFPFSGSLWNDETVQAENQSLFDPFQDTQLQIAESILRESPLDSRDTLTLDQASSEDRWFDGNLDLRLLDQIFEDCEGYT